MCFKDLTQEEYEKVYKKINGLSFPPEYLKTEALANLRYLIRGNKREELKEALSDVIESTEKALERSRKAPKRQIPAIIERKKLAVKKFEEILLYLHTLEEELE